MVSLVSCTREYDDHFFAERTESTDTWSTYRSYTSWAEIFVLPSNNVKKELISAIDTAESRIWIEIYMWTDKDLLSAIINAKQRGVDVRVLLEWNVYGTPKINVPVFQTLRSHDIPVKYTNNYRFTFTHAKFFLIDNRYYVSTGNFTRSFFQGNREFIFSDRDADMLWFFELLFEADFAHQNFADYTKKPQNIILSPYDAREQIEGMIQSAKKSVFVYVQTLQDPRILEILGEKHAQWLDIRICTADNESSKNKENPKSLPWAIVKKPYLHAKILLIDGRVFFLWSQNFTTNALENNREVGVFFAASWSLYQTLESQYKKDCKF